MWVKMDVILQWVISLTFVVLIILPKHADGKVHKGTSQCEFYDHMDCYNEGKCTPTVEVCQNMMTSNKVSLDEPDNHMLCYATWKYSNNTLQLVKKGCWMNDDICYGNKQCVENRIGLALNYCCCDGEMCNHEVFFRPSVDTLAADNSQSTKEDERGGDVVRRAGEQQLTNTLLYSIVPIAGVGLLVVTLFFMWRRHQRHLGHTQLPTVDPSLAPTPSQSSLNLQLLELYARGRYGSIWKAQMPDQFVAVKIFPLQDKHSWRAELDIYNLPHMKHENILTFIASEKKDDSLCTELWLITEFQDKGSLCDYLKGNIISWAQLCRIGETMTCGLAYLHDEIPATYNSPAKPAVAHRDFKSKNVLLKPDLSACIADFGLALMFEPGKAFSETHTQVGTRRYMAPEVLEGAICFNRDSFLRIDMYACGLIIWELMSRCAAADGPVDDYHLPFEAEVGLQPSLEEMQTLVVAQKIRPAFNCTWYKHMGLSNLISTVEECWDQDAEARLSAGCVQERISQLARTINSGGHVSGGGGGGMLQLQQQQQLPELTNSSSSNPAMMSTVVPPPPMPHPGSVAHLQSMPQHPPPPPPPAALIHMGGGGGGPPPTRAAPPPPPVALPTTQPAPAVNNSNNTASSFVPSPAVIDTVTLPDAYSGVPKDMSSC